MIETQDFLDIIYLIFKMAAIIFAVIHFFAGIIMFRQVARMNKVVTTTGGGLIGFFSLFHIVILLVVLVIIILIPV